ncbi:MAG: Inward rectifier potassium channel Irk [Chitinophagaceae bacterium]|nr:Inward rectifier potassium channel Irk [Chitinophagaceae bacterium]
MAGPQNRFRLKNIDNTGFGTNSSVEGGRLVNPDGSNNVRKRGLPVWERISFYHTLLRMKRAHFFLTIMLFYTATNIFFASIYFLVGVHNLSGIQHSESVIDELLAAFFFSSQTLTTVGYGHVAPTGLITNAIASTESLIGILAFAVVTGLIYGRFSRPRAFLLFSSNALMAPFKNGKALMLRMATYKNNHLTDVEAQLTIALHVEENGKTVTRFYPLPLEMSRINSMASSWTIVHNITEESPLFNYDQKALSEAKAEVMVYVRAFDDHFSNTVQQRTSYLSSQVLFGARFIPMFQRSDDGSYTLLDLSKINAHEPADLP